MADRPQHSDLINLIEWVPCLKKLPPTFYLIGLSSQIYLTLCTAPSITDFKPTQSWSSLHAWVVSYPVILSMNFVKSRCQVYSILNGRTPGSLSNKIWWPDINSQYTAHGGFWTANHPKKASTKVCRFLLWPPKFTSHPCKGPKYVSPGPALSESFPATNLITSFLITNRINTGVILYDTQRITNYFFPWWLF